jgi:formylglycine-generating enzyme required for sulfatase activity
MPALPDATTSAALKRLGSVFTNAVGAEMVYIPPGEFMMGSTKEEQAWAVAGGAMEENVKAEGEAPRKAVIKQGFWMARTEVTVGQWKQFVAATGYRTVAEQRGYVDYVSSIGHRVTGASWKDPKFTVSQQDSHPVCCLTRIDAEAFCKWLTGREREAGRLSAGWVVRLPSEAEWEYSCRAGTQTRFWWGESPDDSKDRVNWAGLPDGFEFTSPVDFYGARGRNKFGLADMLGNLHEWCLDSFDPAGAHPECWQDPREWGVVRGGSYVETAGQVRCASRCKVPINSSAGKQGLRVCLAPEVSGTATTTASASFPSVSKESGILAPPETRVTALTTNPKVGEVYTLPLGSNVTMELMGIPPGEFLLGSTKEEQAWALANKCKEEYVKCEGDAPRKAMIKQGFWMGRTEVTVGQWKQFVKETGYVTDGERKGESYVQPTSGGPYGPMKGKNWRDPNFGFELKDNHPVSCISWNDAKSFCEWLQRREQQAGRVARGYTVRLPTEAEWEYACRAGRATRFWWGDSVEDGRDRLNWMGTTDGFQRVAPVDSYGDRGRNGFGLADMLGNVSEWCMDEFDATQAHDELWKGDHVERVWRGGAFVGNPASCRSAFRFGSPPPCAISNCGFRVCYGVDVSGAESSTSPNSSEAAPKDSGFLAPPETRVAALTTTPKVGEVYTLPLGSNVTMELMGIPPGEFMLGSTKEEQAWAVANGRQEEGVKREGEAPRKATIKQGFWMGRTEVTVGQWKQFVKNTGYLTDGEKKGESYVTMPGKSVPKKGVSWRNPDFGFEMEDNHPVSCVSWNDAIAFCEWMTEQERKAGKLPAGMVVRLPTEAEWEYACRAGRQTKFWWGESKEDGKGRLNWDGKDDGFEFVAPVDSYDMRGRNRLGLADMLGNVYEWCLDEYDAKQAHEECYSGTPRARVLRGGAFYHVPATCRAATRSSANPAKSDSHLGFRVVLGMDVAGGSKMASASPPAAPNESGILAPPETGVAALTTTPKVGEVYTLPLGSNVTMELMGIPPGEFLLGSTKEEQAWAVANGRQEGEVKREGNAPRKATIKQGFWMGRTEVTVGQWKHFVAATNYQSEAEKSGMALCYDQPTKTWINMVGKNWRDPNFGLEMRADHPVSCISWNDAMAFCEWLTEHERKAGQMATGMVVRLPTEAEWEYACRAKSQTKWWWGDSMEDGKGRLNWGGKDDGYEFVAPVDSYDARGRNQFGLADMLGNVWEWCLDGLNRTQTQEDLWTGNPDERMLRGASFTSSPAHCRCATRGSFPPSYLRCYNGFRVVVGVAVAGAMTTTASTSPAAKPKETGVLAPAETRVAALTTTPKVGEVYTLPLGSNVTMELMGIPPGEFMLGSTKEEQAWAIADGCKEEYVRWEGEAQRKARINQGFWLGRTGVTVGQWKLFVKETGYVTYAEQRGEACVPGGPPGTHKPSVWVKGKSWRDTNFGFEPQDHHPVCCVNWNDAKAFCEWLDGRERRGGRLAQGYGVRLPTEAEREYACRAGTQTKWWWGDSREDGRGRLNCGGGDGNDDGFVYVAPVDHYGARGRNRFGLADMLGSLWEWCLDEFDAAQAHETLWTGNTDLRASRGGCFFSGLNQCRSAARSRIRSTQPDGSYGFRVCVGANLAGSATSVVPGTRPAQFSSAREAQDLPRR